MPGTFPLAGDVAMTSRRPLTPEERRQRAEWGRRGGEAKAAKLRAEKAPPAPFAGTMLDMMTAAGLTGETWAAWRVFWKAVFALPMEPHEVDLYRRHTARETPPLRPVLEAWQPIGRRGGKSRNAAVAAAYLAIRRDHTATLAPGERGVIPIIAADRKQSGQVLRYLKGLAAMEQFKPYVERVLSESVEFRTGVTVEVFTASFRSTRGYTVVGLVADEVAFWRSDDSASPDAEVLNALRPGMATVPDALLLGLSTPYAKRGELYRAVEEFYGQDSPEVLVWNADTRSMNPGVPERTIKRAFEDDPVAAAAEYGQDGRVEFRRDVEAFLDPDAVMAVTATGRRELSPMAGTHYYAFADPSGGSQDSFTLAIAHTDGAHAVLDAVREKRPPFSPDAVVQEFAELLKSYRVQEVQGDRYAGEWPRERFTAHGITYRPSERVKSDIYREMVAPINAARVTLLDLPVLRAQLIGLERRVSRSGKDSIDHGPGARDDVANAAAGALVLALERETKNLSGICPVGLSAPSRWLHGEPQRSATWAPWMDHPGRGRG